MGKKKASVLSRASKAQMTALGLLMTPPGERLKVQPDPNNKTLADGVYIIRSDGKWVMSLYRNVLTEGNDVEIAIDVEALTAASLAPQNASTVRAWLDELRAELEHAPSGKHHTAEQVKGGVEPFRVGLKVDQAKSFVTRLRDERRKHKGMWTLAAALPRRMATYSFPIEAVRRSFSHQRARHHRGSLSNCVNMTFPAAYGQTASATAALIVHRASGAPRSEIKEEPEGRGTFAEGSTR